MASDSNILEQCNFSSVTEEISDMHSDYTILHILVDKMCVAMPKRCQEKKSNDSTKKLCYLALGEADKWMLMSNQLNNIQILQDLYIVWLDLCWSFVD